jgi:hypothetical protein
VNTEAYGVISRARFERYGPKRWGVAVLSPLLLPRLPLVRTSKAAACDKKWLIPFFAYEAGYAARGKTANAKIHKKTVFFVYQSKDYSLA